MGASAEVILVESARLQGTRPSAHGFQVPTVGRLASVVLQMPQLMPDTILRMMESPDFDVDDVLAAASSKRKAIQLGGRSNTTLTIRSGTRPAPSCPMLWGRPNVVEQAFHPEDVDDTIGPADAFDPNHEATPGVYALQHHLVLEVAAFLARPASISSSVAEPRCTRSSPNGSASAST